MSFIALGSLNPRTPAQRSEVVIERAIFLHEEDDMLDVGERASRGRSLREHSADIEWHQRLRRGGDAEGCRAF